MTVIIDTISPGEWSGSSPLLLYTMAVPQITQAVLSEGIVIVQVYTNNAWVGLPGNIIYGQHLGLYEYQYWLNNARLRCNVVNGGPPAVDVIVKVTVMD